MNANKWLRPLGLGLVMTLALFQQVSVAAADNGGGNSGAIWTTTGSCGDPQNVNQYNVGDTVYINGANFAQDDYDWMIINPPGNKGVVKSSGDVNVGADGKFCFAAYTIQDGDSGEFQASVGNKKDNFRVGEESTVPEFPDCSDLSGQAGDIAHYDSGLHQIAGGDLMEGSDDVYSLSDGNAVQCFCPDTGMGVQTNWWKTDEDAPSADWIVIDNGSSWGLDDARYLAMNSDFDCGNPPQFPSCMDLLADPGDIASYDSGMHQIPGGDLMEGTDDVYSVSDGNAVQCFCPPDGAGIQSNWWKTDDDAPNADWIVIDNGDQWGLDVARYLVMNSHFDCGENQGGGEGGGEETGANITVTKIVVNDDQGTSQVSDFTLKVGQAVVTSGVLATNFAAGDYDVTESGPTDGYVSSYSGNCDADGHITMEAGKTYHCTITNNDVGPGSGGEGQGGGENLAANITVTLDIVNDNGGDAVVSDFTLKVGQAVVTSGVLATNFAAGDYDVTQTGAPDGYTITFSGDCDSEGHITMTDGNTYSCTITADDPGVAAPQTLGENTDQTDNDQNEDNNGGSRVIGAFVGGGGSVLGASTDNPDVGLDVGGTDEGGPQLSGADIGELPRTGASPMILLAFGLLFIALVNWDNKVPNLS